MKPIRDLIGPDLYFRRGCKDMENDNNGKFVRARETLQRLGIELEVAIDEISEHRGQCTWKVNNDWSYYVSETMLWTLCNTHAIYGVVPVFVETFKGYEDQVPIKKVVVHMKDTPPEQITHGWWTSECRWAGQEAVEKPHPDDLEEVKYLNRQQLMSCLQREIVKLNSEKQQELLTALRRPYKGIPFLLQEQETSLRPVDEIPSTEVHLYYGADFTGNASLVASFCDSLMYPFRSMLGPKIEFDKSRKNIESNPKFEECKNDLTQLGLSIRVDYEQVYNAFKRQETVWQNNNTWSPFVSVAVLDTLYRWGFRVDVLPAIRELKTSVPELSFSSIVIRAENIETEEWMHVVPSFSPENRKELVLVYR